VSVEAKDSSFVGATERRSERTHVPMRNDGTSPALVLDLYVASGAPPVLGGENHTHFINTGVVGVIAVHFQRPGFTAEVGEEAG
jgi:hypothetical protein